MGGAASTGTIRQDALIMALFRPLLPGALLPERALASLGAAIGIAVTALACHRLALDPAALPAIVAPIGASAVLVFAVPASPLAQPWPVVGGNMISALVGIAVAAIVPDLSLAAGLAVGGAILAMSMLRCLHPPGGAAALTAVIGGPAVHAAGFGFALVPVGLNSAALVAIGVAFHRVRARSYPHRTAPPPINVPAFDRSDIDAALAAMHESFDIAREDLDALLQLAERHAIERRGRG
jgi:CBS domain-containing membrane protein